MKKLLIPPCAPALMVLATCLWTIWDETSSGPPRMIHGEPDDAPGYAALLLAFSTPLCYVAFALLNWIDSASDPFRNPLPWLASSSMTMVIAALLSKVFCIPHVDASPTSGVTAACLIACLTIWPMCLLRRLAFSKLDNGEDSARTHPPR